jgi:hypothetical protein
VHHILVYGVYSVGQRLRILSNINVRIILWVTLYNKTQYSFFCEATGQPYTQHLQWGRGGAVLGFRVVIINLNVSLGFFKEGLKLINKLTD